MNSVSDLDHSAPGPEMRREYTVYGNLLNAIRRHDHVHYRVYSPEFVKRGIFDLYSVNTCFRFRQCVKYFAGKFLRRLVKTRPGHNSVDICRADMPVMVVIAVYQEVCVVVVMVVVVVRIFTGRATESILPFICLSLYLNMGSSYSSSDD